MTSLGAIVRSDQGGLANQTQDLARYLEPDLVLVVDLPAHLRRGDSQLHRLAHLPIVATVDTDTIPPGLLVELARNVDTLVTVECLYTGPHGQPTWRAVNSLTRSVLVANPELYGDYPATRIVLPTTWHTDRFPGARVVPHPVDVTAAAPFARRRSGPVRTFLHVEAPAMCDRNGSELVAKACQFVTEDCTLVVRSHHTHRRGLFGEHRIGRVRIVWDNSRPESWVGCYHATEADVLLMPRRYGGLSMVAQEAAALGMPSVMLDVEPQRGEDWPGWRVPAYPLRNVLMRGGEFPVHTCHAEQLADVMNSLARGELDVAVESGRALAWAEARSWPTVEPLWRNALQLGPLV